MPKDVRLNYCPRQDTGRCHLQKNASAGCFLHLWLEVACPSFSEGRGKDSCPVLSLDAGLIQIGKESGAGLD